MGQGGCAWRKIEEGGATTECRSKGKKEERGAAWACDEEEKEGPARRRATRREEERGGGVRRWGRQAAVDAVLPYEPKAGDVHGVADGWARGLQ
jgi:hypothetical protein